MTQHEVYTRIVEAVQQGTLMEPFTKRDFRVACPGLGEGTYNAFMDKHAVGNPGGSSELFVRVAPGRFRLQRPLSYGL